MLCVLQCLGTETAVSREASKGVLRFGYSAELERYIHTASSIHFECSTSASSVDADTSSLSEYDEHEQCGRRE